MSELTIWLVAGLVVYAAFCLYWGISIASHAKDAKSFFLADRRLPSWVFVLAATNASFSGWVLLGHTDILFRDGFAFAEVSLCAVIIPLAGVLVLKRQWMLGKRFGYVTPVEMLGEYFDSEFVRILVLVIALVFAIPFVGMQIGATGSLLSYLSNGAIDRVAAMWILSAIVFVYICFGGLRAAAYVGTLQALLLGAGIVAIGLIVYWQVGGFGAFNAALAKLGADKAGNGSILGSILGSIFEIPGVMQFTRGLGIEAPSGGFWTAGMISSYCMALMGLQLTPAFTMLAFASRSPKGFVAQQTWASAGIMGAVFVFFLAAAGIGARLLPGAQTDTATAVGVVIASLGAHAPWFVALLAVCALAAVQGLAALYLSATSTMLVRDFYRRYVDPALDIDGQRLYARIVMALLLIVTLLIATFAPKAQADLGALALGFGFQLLPALIGLCWLRWITREAAMVGLAFGLVAVIFTENFGLSLAQFVGLHLPWGRWPWTIHSAGWGIVCNVAACIVISLISQRSSEKQRRQRYHDFLETYDAPIAARYYLRPVAWAGALAWLFFAVGPGVLYGNYAFGNSRGGPAEWYFGMPPLWIWQIGCWAAGVLLIWFLASHMGFSTVPDQPIELMARSQRPKSSVAALPEPALRRWFWTIVLAACVAIFANWAFG
jgi:solute:Na+ symporter, SSS family